jgi:formate hydrogenlyase transcriptional activator
MPFTTQGIETPEQAVSDERQLQALIEVFDCISCHTDLPELFDDFASRLRRFVPFDALYVTLYDSVRDVMRVSFVETTSPMAIPVGLEIPVSESPSGVALETQQAVLLEGIAGETRFPVATRVFVESDIQRVCLLPLTTAKRKLGAVAFGRKEDAMPLPGSFLLSSGRLRPDN